VPDADTPVLDRRPTPVSSTTDDLDRRRGIWRALDLTSNGRFWLRRRGIDIRLFGIYVHHLAGPDPGLDLHDHPWSAVTIFLTGGTRERWAQTRDPGREEIRTFKRGSIRRLRVTEAHTIVDVEPRTFTIVLRGPRRPTIPVGNDPKKAAAWGFYQPNDHGSFTWVPHTVYDYAARRPCEVARR
jgi:hypothetical protein